MKASVILVLILVLEIQVNLCCKKINDGPLYWARIFSLDFRSSVRAKYPGAARKFFLLLKIYDFNVFLKESQVGRDPRARGPEFSNLSPEPGTDL